MPKFKVLISGMAVVNQEQIIEAENAEEAREKAVQPNVYNNGTWDTCDVDGRSIQCDDVEGGY